MPSLSIDGNSHSGYNIGSRKKRTSQMDCGVLDAEIFRPDEPQKADLKSRLVSTSLWATEYNHCPARNDLSRLTQQILEADFRLNRGEVITCNLSAPVRENGLSNALRIRRKQDDRCVYRAVCQIPARTVERNLSPRISFTHFIAL
jgi:hypothetical protein